MIVPESINTSTIYPMSIDYSMSRAWWQFCWRNVVGRQEPDETKKAQRIVWRLGREALFVEQPEENTSLESGITISQHGTLIHVNFNRTNDLIQTVLKRDPITRRSKRVESTKIIERTTSYYTREGRLIDDDMGR